MIITNFFSRHMWIISAPLITVIPFQMHIIVYMHHIHNKKTINSAITIIIKLCISLIKRRRLYSLLMMDTLSLLLVLVVVSLFTKYVTLRVG